MESQFCVVPCIFYLHLFINISNLNRTLLSPSQVIYFSTVPFPSAPLEVLYFPISEHPPIFPNFTLYHLDFGERGWNFSSSFFIFSIIECLFYFKTLAEYFLLISSIILFIHLGLIIKMMWFNVQYIEQTMFSVSCTLFRRILF